ncbi:hypothetical protein V2A60_006895 [Cordyceps javanica]|uniref:Allergen Asp F4-like protein n=1 Tax=Cordyceps javanica TaxID=43265 RepID=A0A545VKI7_9HYPO|nr:allergen Asp F4-like protein [Cordyceps javanica]TQW02229.1 allergen Asp F4-like protein [Cordyceps javanica]
MKFSAAVVLAAAMGVSAHPSHRAHHNAHRSVQNREFVYAKKPAPVVVAAPEPSAAAPAPPPAVTSVASVPAVPAQAPPAVKTAASVDASSSPSSGGGAKPFCTGVKKRATVAQIAYAGNTGSNGQYGCNMQQVDPSTASEYDYTMTFDNMGGSEQACVCWNKIGPTGLIDGFFNGKQALNFTLPVGGKACVALEGNSQIGCTCGANEVPLTQIGQFAGTWVEADVANESNQQWSGFDASAIVAGVNGMPIPGLKVCGNDICSTVYNGGRGDNAYLHGMEDEDGIGANIPKGPLHMTVKVDFQ